jgi:transcriptional regulator with AAA-type ATPase domain
VDPSRRFALRDGHAHDRWLDRPLAVIDVASSPANLERLRAAFAWHSSLLQNIVAIMPGNFRIRVLTLPLAPDGGQAACPLPAAVAAAALRRSLAFLQAARELRLDFIDFSRWQVMADGTPRFAWSLAPQSLPSPSELCSRFHARGDLPGAQAGSASGDPDHLCRREDLASHRLLAPVAVGLGRGVRARIRIHTRFPWQEEIVCDSLYHNLSAAETLLLHVDLGSATLGRRLAALCRSHEADDAPALARDLRLFLKRSVFREIVLLVRGPASREDADLLRFLLEDEDLAGVSAVLFGGIAPGGCDLEFSEDPPNALAAPPARAGENGGGQAQLDDGERQLLETLAAIGVPVPEAVARLLSAEGPGADPLAGLRRRRLLRESRAGGGLLACLADGCAAAPPERALAALARIAERCDWPYARLRCLLAGERPGQLAEHLRLLAREQPGRIAPGPAADLLGGRLARCGTDDEALAPGIEVLIQGGCLEQAGRLLRAMAAPLPAWARLKKAHLALCRREYREMGRLLAGLPTPQAEWRDEWLYLNFMRREKLARPAAAAGYAARIASPYYRGLALVQQSDRAIYGHEFAVARAQLQEAGALLGAGGGRAGVAARSQQAKLLREEGRFAEAEALYKAIFVQSGEEGPEPCAAAAAVDLGNLYVEADDDFLAECWYRKAEQLYARAGHADGRMLVNANLANVLLAKGDWLQAERLLEESLAWDEEKNLPGASGVDLLNRAGLEVLRLRDEKALQLATRAEAAFRAARNRKGVGECAFLRLRAGGDPGPFRSGLGAGQRAVLALLRRRAPARADDGGRDLQRRLQAVASRRLRFEALRLLLHRHRRREWLEAFRELAWELSAQEKNYYYHEYWYMFFDLAADGEALAHREELLATHEFFARNRRVISARLDELRRSCAACAAEAGRCDEARLVEQRRRWRRPDDFFRGLFRELGRAAPVDWLALAVHERERELFRFASSDSFRELGAEMLRRALAEPLEQDHDLAEVRRLYRSPERLVYPFAATRLLRLPLGDGILACLAIGSRDGALRLQDLRERCRETFRFFSLLFRDFLENEHRVGDKLDFIVGESEAVLELKRQIARVARVDFSLLIAGESGSGKELVARAVHQLGPRAQRPFVSVNAAAIPDTLLEAELFGYRKGAFSGASESRVGLLEAADGGTLFLDEIADLPLGLQAKLLRALQEREIRRLGENRPLPIDVRVVSASNRDLEEMVRGKLFRADLLYRLQDLVIRVPPLRERREDIPLLVGHFLRKHGHSRLDRDRLEGLASRFRGEDFPGNVRELESRVKNLITFDTGLDAALGSDRPPFSWRSARAEFERGLLLRVLAEQQGRRNRAAERLGISRMALFNLLRKHGIDA